MGTGRPKGIPKTGGRVKGTKNKRIDARELAEKIGVDPLEVLMRFAKGDFSGYDFDPEEITPLVIITAAKEATKYIYATQKAVEISGSVGHTHQIGTHDRYIESLYNQIENKEPQEIQGEIINADSKEISQESRTKTKPRAKAKAT